MKNVMVVIDESNSSYELLIWALENHKETIESSKVFIFATQPQNPFTPPTVLSSSVGFAQIFYPFSPNSELIRLAHEKNMRIALGILEKAKNICLSHGIKAETFTYAGEPNDLIPKIIQERQIDVLVMSAQQTQKCLHNTDCSLITVKKRLVIQD